MPASPTAGSEEPGCFHLMQRAHEMPGCSCPDCAPWQNRPSGPHTRGRPFQDHRSHDAAPAGHGAELDVARLRGRSAKEWSLRGRPQYGSRRLSGDADSQRGHRRASGSKGYRSRHDHHRAPGLVPHLSLSGTELRPDADDVAGSKSAGGDQLHAGDHDQSGLVADPADTRRRIASRLDGLDEPERDQDVPGHHPLQRLLQRGAALHSSGRHGDDRSPGGRLLLSPLRGRRGRIGSDRRHTGTGGSNAGTGGATSTAASPGWATEPAAVDRNGRQPWHRWWRRNRRLRSKCQRRRGWLECFSWDRRRERHRGSAGRNDNGTGGSATGGSGASTQPGSSGCSCIITGHERTSWIVGAAAVLALFIARRRRR